MGRMSGDASKDIGQPGLRIDTIHFAVTIRLYMAAAPSSTVGATERPGLSSEGDASQAYRSGEGRLARCDGG